MPQKKNKNNKKENTKIWTIENRLEKKAVKNSVVL